MTISITEALTYGFIAGLIFTIIAFGLILGFAIVPVFSMVFLLVLVAAALRVAAVSER